MLSIDDVLENFRSALISLLPHLSRVRIEWRTVNAYDAWDELATSLYRHLVIDPVRWSAHDPEADIAPYDTMLTDYSRFSFIELVERTSGGAGGGSERQLVLHSFNQDDGFRTARCRIWHEAYGTTEPALVSRNLEAATFVFVHRHATGKTTVERIVRI